MAITKVDGNLIKDNTIEENNILDGNVTAAKIANNAVTGDKILDGNVTESKIANNAVTGNKILDDSITGDKIANNAVTGDKILDGNVIESKIANNAVTESKIANNAVTAAKIANNAVTGDKILDGNVTESKIANNAVTGNKIPDNSLTQEKIYGGGITPIGTILPFASDTEPTGWMVCDGRHLLRASYPELFAVIGQTWGSSSGDSFNIPDLRGRFLRGRDNGAGRDPDAASRASDRTGAASGDNVGSIQGDATKRPNNTFTGTIAGSTDTAGYHTHDMQSNATNGSAGTSAPYSSVGSWSYVNNDDIRGNGDHSHSITSGSATIDSGGDNETRPINIYVNYIIKF